MSPSESGAAGRLGAERGRAAGGQRRPTSVGLLMVHSDQDRRRKGGRRTGGGRGEAASPSSPTLSLPSASAGGETLNPSTVWSEDHPDNQDDCVAQTPDPRLVFNVTFSVRTQVVRASTPCRSMLLLTAVSSATLQPSDK